MGEKGEGIGSTNWQLQNSHGAVKYSIENIVSRIIITVVTDWHRIYWNDHFISDINVKSPCCTPETNRILYVNFNWKILFKLKKKRVEKGP